MNSETKSPRAARRVVAGRLLILTAALLWSTNGFFAKSPVFADWPVLVGNWAVRGPALAFWRALFACLILFPLVRQPRWTVRLLPSVCIFAAMNFTFLTAMTTTTAANAIWLQYTAPVWVFLFSGLVLRDRMVARDGWLLVFGLAGVSLILAFELRGHAWIGIGYGIASGITYAGVLLSLRWLRDEDAAWIVALNHLVTAAVFAPYVWSCNLQPTSEQFVYLVAFGMLQMGFPYWLFARGIRSVPSHEASIIALLEPVLVPAWVYLAWRHHPSYEPPAWWTLAGGGLILTGLLLRYVSLPRGRVSLPRGRVSPPRGRNDENSRAPERESGRRPDEGA